MEIFYYGRNLNPPKSCKIQICMQCNIASKYIKQNLIKITRRDRFVIRMKDFNILLSAIDRATKHTHNEEDVDNLNDIIT